MGAYSYSGTAASNTTVDGIGAAGSDSPDNIDNLVRALAASDANLVRDLGGANTSAGSSTAYTLTLSDVSTPTYFDGMTFSFRPHTDSASTGPTLNVSSLGAKTIKRGVQGAETNLIVGDLQSGQTATVVYRSAWGGGSGAFELLNPSVTTDIQLGNASDTTLSRAGPGLVRVEGYQLNRVQYEAAQESTTGTEIDFTGLPDWVQSIDIMLDSVSLSGTDSILIQLGDSGGFETSGYTSQSYTLSSAPAIVELTSVAGFVVRSATAGRAVTALVQLRLTNPSTETWVCTHNGIVTATTAGIMGGGSKATSGDLTQVRITTTGTNTFDAGTIRLFYAG